MIHRNAVTPTLFHTRTHRHTDTHTRTHTQTHAYTPRYTTTQTHTYKHGDLHLHREIHTHGDTLIYKHIHRHIHTHTHTHIHAHQHTFMRMLIQFDPHNETLHLKYCPLMSYARRNSYMNVWVLLRALIIYIKRTHRRTHTHTHTHTQRTAVGAVLYIYLKHLTQHNPPWCTFPGEIHIGIQLLY